MASPISIPFSCTTHIHSFALALFTSLHCLTAAFLSFSCFISTGLERRCYTFSVKSCVHNHVLAHLDSRFFLRCRSAPFLCRSTRRNEISHAIPLKVPRSTGSQHRLHQHRSLVTRRIE